MNQHHSEETAKPEVDLKSAKRQMDSMAILKHTVGLLRTSNLPNQHHLGPASCSALPATASNPTPVPASAILEHRPFLTAFATLTLALTLTAQCTADINFQPYDIVMPTAEYKRLDTFEAHTLAKADQSFTKGNFRQAAKEYDAFIMEFPKSKVLPYAVFRKGRSIHRDDKRYDAIKVYNEVMDYFPNNIHYASAALYCIGLAAWENGDEQAAVKAWAEMADDTDYSKHELAADAINRLADYLVKHKEVDRGVGYFEQVATDFRTKSPIPALQAIQRCVEHYIRTKPNEPKLRELYAKWKGFQREQYFVPQNLDQDPRYWECIHESVNQLGLFNEAQAPEKKRYYASWAKTMDNRFLTNDLFRIDVIGYQLAADGDQNKWIERLDKQFNDYQKNDNPDRITLWIKAYCAHKNKIEEYYKKLKFESMNYIQLSTLMNVLYDNVGNKDMGRIVFRKIKLDKIDDKEKAKLARSFWRRDPPNVEIICNSFQDNEYGSMELLCFYQDAGEAEKGIRVAESLSKSERYAQEAIWIKAGLLSGIRKYVEAIDAYRQSNRAPLNFWRIVDCLMAMGKRDEAIAQLFEIESFFPPEASKAALAVANIYGSAGLKEMQIAQLRAVILKYPKSGESSTAHRQLESLGVRIGQGGVEERDR